MNRKSLILAAMLTLGATAAFAAAPGCIGGCLGTAPNVGNVDLPAGYQCLGAWPALQHISCVIADDGGFLGGGTGPHSRPFHKKP